MYPFTRNAAGVAVSNEGSSVESSDGARREEAGGAWVGVVVGWNKSKSCVNTG